MRMLLCGLVYVCAHQAAKIVDRQLLERNMTHLYRQGTWQYNMLAACKSRYSVQPKRLEAIVFYLQNHDGSHSQLTRHGGCPVLRVSTPMI